MTAINLGLIQFRRNTAAGAATNNRVLNAGEPDYIVDTNQLFVGDGTTHLNDLEPIGGGPAIKWHALLIDDSTPVDGTATMIDVITYEGPITVDLATLVGAIGGFTLPTYVGRDHTPGTLWTPTMSGPWVEQTVTSGELVFFAGVNSLAIAVSQTGPDSLNEAGVPAQQVNLNNTSAARVYSDTTWTNITPTTDVPHDPSGLSGEAWMRGVDAALGSIVAGSGGVPTSRTINGHDLTADRTLTPSDIGSPSGSGTSSGTNTGDETASTIGALIAGATGKTTPVDADLLPLSDSAASNVTKKLTLANLKATLKAYFDPLYDAAGAAAAVTAASISAVPTSRTVAGHALSSNVTVTASDVGAPSGSGTSSGTNTGDETVTSLGATVHAATSKTTPVDADELGLVDSAASNVLKRLTVANLKALLDARYDAAGAAAAVTTTSIGAVPTARTVTAGTGLTGGGDLSANRSLAVSYGTASGTAAQGNDDRFTTAPSNLGTGTTNTTSSHASLLPSTPNIIAATGDVLRIEAEIRVLNNTGSTQSSDAVIVKLGATTMLTLPAPGLSTSASARYTKIDATIPVGASNTTRGASGAWAFDNLTFRRDRGAGAVDLTSGAALDITGRTSSGTNEEIQVMWCVVTRNRA